MLFTESDIDFAKEAAEGRKIESPEYEKVDPTTEDAERAYREHPDLVEKVKDLNDEESIRYFLYSLKSGYSENPVSDEYSREELAAIVLAAIIVS